VELLEGVAEGDVVGVFTDVTEGGEDEANGAPMPGLGMFGGGRP
jgi:hypothetical protein